MLGKLSILAVVLVGAVGVFLITLKEEPNVTAAPTPNEPAAAGDETATIGAGCFWCVEAVFKELKGVKSVVSGYTGGTTANPTYEQICRGDTGHAEVIQIVFDPKVISYEDLLQVFWKTHDPTTLNRQGNDVGTQYRSAVFYHSAEQKKLAEKYRRIIDDAKIYDLPVVTEIVELGKFYPAEKYHQDYFANNPNQAYCRATIPPKLEKLQKLFADKLKKDKN